MSRSAVNIRSVHQCNCYMGCSTQHPLVSVIDLSKADLRQCALKFDLYTVLLLEAGADDYFFGRKSCDYSNASLLFLTPGETAELNRNETLPQKGWMLTFHPDLLRRTSLGQNLKNYSFFFYKPDEALHLSLREKAKAEECLRCIGQELQHAIDYHSKTLISRYIELFLDYCSRFCERQFITRCEENKTLVNKTDRLLDEYMQSGKLQRGILPSDEYCAGELDLSPAYFHDLLKFETGMNLTEYFELKRLETAKKMLSKRDNTASAVAGILGYPNVQYFSRLFKKLTGTAPNDYKNIS